MASSSFRSFIRAAIPFILLSFIISFSLAASSPPAAAVGSPSAEAETICHTNDNRVECYPRVFSPTEEFQTVRDDQDLPPGLHIRMNIWTGQKEARLNIPMADDPALEGLPVDQAVIVVDADLPPQEPQLPSGAPAYESVGVVKEPPVHNPDFAAALDFVKGNAEAAPSAEKHPLDDALLDLEDISHDMYYGKKITEDANILQSLFCLLTQRDAQQVRTRSLAERRDFLASSILASSLQNNPPALRDVEAQWDALMNTQCASHQQPLKDIFFNSLEPIKTSTTNRDDSPEATWIRTMLPVVGRLLKSDIIRTQFMESGGMKSFLQILLAEGKEWEAPRARVARIVSDTFLDETVGARLGLWPTQHTSGDEVCRKESSSLDEGCWEFHLEGIKTTWASDLLTMLESARPGPTRQRNQVMEEGKLGIPRAEL
ncbi:hypothetical protein BJ170DRAFT_589613 [Xylariales sp. AK1849]|nr:hypothetical protein BJ170DRAFT_589613 [Xylariales sp. AK1849]